MFAKPYSLKSNNALKNSEKKHLVQRVQDEFPSATEEKVKELLPPKGTCSCMKVVLHSGDTVSVFVVDGSPLLVDSPHGLIPTVCALWKVPDLVPLLTIHSPVLAKVQNGAPLYLPGVSLPALGEGFPLIQCGALLGARTEDNAAACLVGRAAMSSADMLLRASGVCLDILHVYGDSLCRDQKFIKMERPKIAARKSTGIPINLSSNFKQISLQKEKEEWPTLGPKPAAVPRVDNAPAVIPVETTEPVECEENSESNLLEASPSELEIPTDMDALLRWCLLSFLKLEAKSVQLPLKTNLLYKNHMQPYCPSDRTLDVKKSSYKKLSKFLEAMQQEGLVETREVERGVAAVVALRPAHPAARAHRPAPRAPAPAPVDERPYVPPLVREMYCVTAAVLDLFAPLKKGSPLTAGEVRATLTEYVRSKGLSQAKGAVAPDALLARIINAPQQEPVRWEALTAGVLARMTAATEMRFADGALSLAKSRLQPVRMDVALRSGNKKVTLVSNLESFGFNLSALAAVCQRAIAASCGVTRSPAARADQLMLQGDQTHFVAKLLIEKYELPKKFVEGADKALNKKK